MSRTTVLAVVPDRRPGELVEFRNSWGWAPRIWDSLLAHRGETELWLRNDNSLNRLWDEIEDLPEWQQAPLVLTFDTGIIPMGAFEWAADQLEEFDRRLPTDPSYVNHVPAMVELFRSKPECPLIGVYGTSVSENPFDPWDYERDEPGNGIPLAKMYPLRRHWPLIPDWPLNDDVD